MNHPHNPHDHCTCKNHRQWYRLSRHRSTILFILVGVASLVWFLLRTGRKPSRAVYPCQQIAAANAVLFLGWLAGLGVTHRLFRLVSPVRQKLFLFAAVLVVAGGGVYFQYSRHHPTIIWGQTTPSRVVWVQDTRAAKGWSNNAWEARADQVIVQQMLDQGIMKLTDQPTVAAAWTTLFQRRNSDSHDYRTGETIAIKINNNNMYFDYYTVLLNPSIQVIRAVLDELVNKKGIPQQNIWVYDAVRRMTDYQIQGIRSQFPNVVLNPNHPDPTDPTCTESTTVVNGVALAKTVEQATYIINMPLLRTHGLAGVTLSFKNHWGSICTPWNVHNNFFNTSPTGNDLVQINAHPFIRNKTLVVIDDALYGVKSNGPDANPDDTNDGIKPYPNSIFLSTDSVAIDSVMIDYLESKGSTIYQTGGDPRIYLRAAAQIGLGNFASSCTGINCNFTYTNINLVRCSPTCPGATASPTPGPSVSPSPTVSPVPSASPYLPGDVNHDGSINSSDAVSNAFYFGQSSSIVPGYFDAFVDQKINTLDFWWIVKNWNL